MRPGGSDSLRKYTHQHAFLRENDVTVFKPIFVTSCMISIALYCNKLLYLLMFSFIECTV